MLKMILVIRVFNTGEIVDSQASTPFTFSNPGVYNYEAEGDPGVTMTGSVTVGNIQSPVTPSQLHLPQIQVQVVLIP